MTLPNEASLKKLQFYVTTPYQCGYLSDQLAQSLIATPQNLVDTSIYSGLIQQGFRRSGRFTYKPHCEKCQACVPVRIVLDQFKASRSQKRVAKKHRDLAPNILRADYYERHFKLYAQYQAIRHPETLDTDNNDLDNIEQYKQFLCHSNVESMMIEFIDAHGQVKIVSVVDMLADGISAVYTFYDATSNNTSYGTYTIMWLIHWAKKLGLRYLYLGYWIAKSPKMAYKENFRPLQKLINQQWQD